MEIMQKKSGMYLGGRILPIFFFLLFIIAGNQLGAQSLLDSSTSSSSSLSSAPKVGDEMKKMDEARIKKQQHDELMSYIYMGLGFSIVIAIAWVTTSLAKKRRMKADVERAKRAQQMHHQHPHRKPTKR
jgi:TRAP-type C4-dicarboxylate transport system permease small subunit